MSQSGWGRSLRRYLVAGVLVWLPILATLWVISVLVDLTDQTLLLLPESLRPEAVVGFALPGLGALMAFVILLATGLLATNLVGRQLVAWWEGLMRRIPLVRSVYGGVKSFAESVFSPSTRSFRKVVMIQYPRPGVRVIGFMTAEDVPEISRRTGEQQVCIYIPTTPNPTSGLIIMVPRSEVVELDMSIDAAMKWIVTLGVVVPAEAASRVPVAPPRIAHPAA
jgi:uncharacterized membrane protein